MRPRCAGAPPSRSERKGQHAAARPRSEAMTTRVQCGANSIPRIPRAPSWPEALS
jgi:hypothetical protein